MKKQSAFTLIELMIVMAIIAILATAGIQAYTGYIKKSRDTARAEIASNLNTAVMSYAASNGGMPPLDAVAFNNFLASAGEVFSGSVYNPATGKLVEDPIGGKDVCLDAQGGSTESCAFHYTAYDDGTYAISYGVEHESSREGNFYKTTNSVVNETTSPTQQDIGGQATTTKYGIYIGSAKYIGQPSIMTSADPEGELGIDTTQTPSLGVSFRSIRMDVPTVSSGVGSGGTPPGSVILGDTCAAIGDCLTGLSCVSNVCTLTSSIAVGASCGTIGTYDTVKAKDNRCWLTTNLSGLYQWGQPDNTHTPAPEADENSWTGMGGTNNPCPSRSHVPTSGEWVNLVSEEGITNIATAASSTLALPTGGYYNPVDNSTNDLAYVGNYWSSNGWGSGQSFGATFVLFNDTNILPEHNNWGYYGYSVRCIVNQ